jgi:hypothetical protein
MGIMDFIELKKLLKDAAMDGTLITDKHDPANLNIVYPSFRTVIAHDLALNLVLFIDSEKYTVNEYLNNDNLNSPYLYTISPIAESNFSVAASGVPAYSQFATSVMDTIVAVSGEIQGLHIYGETNDNICQKVNNGVWVFNAKLR